LDSAGYGPVTITQSISLIAAPGSYAGISVFSGDGIDVNAGGTDTIILRGLTINNQGSTGKGIVFNTGGKLYVEECTVSGFSSAPAMPVGIGLAFLGLGVLEVKATTLRGNYYGIFIKPPSDQFAGFIAQAVLERVSLEGNVLDGLIAWAGSRVTVHDSNSSGNNGAGFKAFSNNTSFVQMHLKDCVAFNNSVGPGGVGIFALAGGTGNVYVDVENCALYDNSTGIQSESDSTGIATVRVSNSTITHNGVGVSNGGPPAVLLSRGNNTVEANSTDIGGTVGAYTAK
jgi:hypothetical protein